jgi:metal-responsive CopG/Arc/MetJ family transcriptional regulator
MKTAISVPDDVFAAAENLAEQLGMSRSQLFSVAVAEFVASHQDAEVTRKLDEVYGQEKAALDPVLAKLQQRRLLRSEW